MNQLTVIITFLNEGIEIKNTLESIVWHLNDDIDILLIDDKSEDGYNYEELASKYHVKYIRNNERLGVARSRDLGVGLCKTPYFLLLDGHMRFYDDRWVKAIISELDKDDRVLLCCQTKFLRKDDQNEIYEKKANKSYGAYLDFDGGYNAFKVDWKYWEHEPGRDIEDIPCVLGATYAASKRYWQYLRGLEGLRYYGSDEPYISFKVWLEGGRCRLLKNIVIGHIYRKRFPYSVDHVFIVYNMLFVAELLLPRKIKYRVFGRIKRIYAVTFEKAYKILLENGPQLNELKNYYRHIFTENFQKILDLQYLPEKIRIEHQKKDIENMKLMAMRLVRHHASVTDVGLLNGKTGLVLFFYHYARYSNEPFYELFADELLDDICNHLDLELPITFGKGICGIGWAIEYLVQHGFVQGDTSEILAEIDLKIMERDLFRMTDWTLDSGVAGVLEYVLIRLKTAVREKKQFPFDRRYLSRLQKVARKMLLNANAADSINAVLQFLEFQDTGYLDTSKPEVSDLFDLRFPEGEISEWPLGLRKGCVGVGIRLMKE